MDGKTLVEGYLNKPRSITQEVYFGGSVDSNSSSIYGKDVTVVPSSGRHSSGSSKVKIKNIVDYGWEHKYYIGHLVATHMGGVCIAYCLKGPGTGQPVGIVRVVNRKTEERALIKGMQGLVVDLSFAHIPNQVVLAVVDEPGNLFVYQIQEGPGNMKYTTILQIYREGGVTFTDNHRVIWCPYIPDDSIEDEDISDDEVTKLLVLTHDEKAEMWNVDMVTKRHGPGPHSLNSVESGYLEILDHMKPIVDAAFSPDGTALATASVDGDVKFFQVYMHNENKPRCLHEWQPHDGRPLSCLFFLDNHKNYNPEIQFWKYAVTGADNNTELKIWSCESWVCLQTIQFVPPDHKRPCFLKAGLDISASYLLLSDVYNRLLYVLQIQQDTEEIRESVAFVSAITEFSLHYPMLSFGIIDAGRRKFRHNSLNQNLDEQEKGDEVMEEEDEGEYVERDVLRLYLIQPKSLQECHIVYLPVNNEQQHNTSSLAALSHDSLMFREGLTDISMNVSSVSDLDVSVPDHPANHSSLIQPPPANQISQQSTNQISLQTPEDFGSPASLISSLTQVTPLAPDINSSICTPKGTSILETSVASSPTLTPSSVPLPPASPDEILALSSPRKPNRASDANASHEEPLATSEPQSVSRIHREGNVSGGSSPSREVQEILAEKTAEDEKNGYYEEEVLDEENNVEAAKEKPSPAKTKPLTTNKSGFPSPPVPPVSTSPLHSTPRGTLGSSLSHIKPTTILTRSSHESSFESVPKGTSGTPKEAKTFTQVLQELQETSPASTRGVNDSAVWPVIPPDLAGEAHKSITEETSRKSVGQAPSLHATLSPGDVDEEAQKTITLGQDTQHDSYSAGNLIDIGDEGEIDGEDEVKQSGGVLQQEPPRIEPSPKRMEVAAAVAAEVTAQDKYNFNKWSQKLDGIVSTLLQNMNSMTQLLRAQQSEIKELRSEIKSIQLSSMSSLSHSNKVEENLMNKTEKSLNRHNQQQIKRIEELLRGRESQDKQRQEMIMSALSQTVTNTINTRLDNTVKSEFKNNVVPVLIRTLDPLKQQLETELAHKLTATDQLLRENIGKMVQSKSVLDMMGHSVTSALQTTIQDTHRESFNSIVLPYFEKACQNMFIQINDSFGKGTKEYVQTLENYLEKNRRQQEKGREPVLSHLQNVQELTERLQATSEHLCTHLKGDLENHMEKTLTGVYDKLTKRIQEVIQEEITKGLKEQQTAIEGSVMTAVRSRTVTPSSHLVDPHLQQAALQQLIASGQINSAFQQALSMENLTLVLYVCERVSPQQVFSQNPCPLQQPVLLSLIQQLSADLNSQVEIKHKYLEEAVMNLDPNNRATLEHIPSVISRLQKQLQNYISANPNSRMIRNMKMLLMATHSLLMPRHS